jgi:hypothetical protein
MKALVVTMMVATSALGQTESGMTLGQSWSAVGPKTLEVQGNSFEVVAGWPGVSASYLRGVVPNVNLGVRASFQYGVEGTLRDVIPGFKAQMLLKWLIVNSERLSFGMVFEPGPFFHSPAYGSTRVGFALPVGLRLGIAAASAVSVAVLFDFPFWLEFGPSGGFNAPLLTGIGLEYFITSEVAIVTRLRMGPTLRTRGLAELTFDGMLGAAFRF